MRCAGATTVVRFGSLTTRLPRLRRRSVCPYLAALPENFKRWEPLAQAQYLEITVFLSQYLLSSQGDRMGMAHSVEGRFPFLDVRLVEFCNALDPRLKLRCLREKWLLKKAAQPWLPDVIRRRPKRPYRAPIHRSFFNDQAPDYVRELLSPGALKGRGPVQAGAGRTVGAQNFRRLADWRNRRHGPGRHPLHSTGRPFVRKEFPSARTTLQQGPGQGLPPEFNRCQFPHGPSLTHLLIMIHRATDLQPRQSASAIERMDFLDLAGEQLYYALHCAQNPRLRFFWPVISSPNGRFPMRFGCVGPVTWLPGEFPPCVSIIAGAERAPGEFHRFTLATWLEDCRAMLGLLKAENPKQPILLGGIGLGGLLVSQLFAEGQGDGMLLWSPAANGAGALRDTLLRRLAFDLANPTTGQPKTWADYETSLQQGESIEAAGYTLSAALWQEAVAMKFILPAGGRDQGIDSRGRPWKVVKLGQAPCPIDPGRRIVAGPQSWFKCQTRPA